jgi:cytochrome c oxidase subunit II
VTDTRAVFDGLLGLYLPIACAVFALVVVLVVGFVVRYRRRGPGLPADERTSPVGEVLYVVTTAAIAVVLVVFTFRATSDIEDPAAAAAPATTVEVIAFKWQWEFRYPDSGRRVVGGPDVPAELVVPVDAPVAFRATSRDVIHSFFVPELRFKRDVFPKDVNAFTLVFPEEGRLRGHCAEFCGLDHARMGFDVVALPGERFAEWERTGRVPA